MDLICPACGFSKTIDATRLPDGATRATCPKCQHNFSLPTGDSPPGEQHIEDFTAKPALQAEAAHQDAVVDIPKAGFWIRLVAAVIDVIIVFTLQFLLGTLLAVAGMASLGINADSAGTMVVLIEIFRYALSFAYYIVFTGSCGQTPGKMAVRVKVIHRNGNPVSFGRAAFREVPAKFISGIILGIGYLMVAFDEQKQGLHDRMAKTYVIKL